MMNTELDALLSRVRDVRLNTAHPDRNGVAYDCLRMFEDLATRYKEEFASRDRYKAQLNAWRDKALDLACRWQPIETAPKDGQTVFIWYGGECVHAAYLAEHHGRIPQWYLLDKWRRWGPVSDPPKHWMPLPAPPATLPVMVVSATDEHPAIFKTSSGKLISGEEF